MEVLTIDQIKAQYPDQWVLIGNPVLRNPNINGSFLSRLIQGIVLVANRDKRELAYQSKTLTAACDETICIYTGEVAKKRVFLL